jgi:hypothetical protein
MPRGRRARFHLVTSMDVAPTGGVGLRPMAGYSYDRALEAN